MKNRMDLTGKTVLVTGANAGIGSGFAQGLAEAGADLVIWGRRADRNEEVAEGLRVHGGKVLAQQVDIADEGQVVAAFAEAVAWSGGIDAVFANAGVTVGYKRIWEITVEQMMQAISINMIGTVLTAREASRHMIERGKGGSIVLTGSTTADLAFPMGIGAYSMTKGAIHTAARVMARELGEYGIRVNCVVPGPVESELQYSEDVARAVIAGLCLGRAGKPDDTGGIAVYLASDASSYQTGSLIYLDGGQSVAK